MFNVTDVLSNFKFQGARPTAFSINIFNPTDSSADASIQFLASASAIPESQLGNIAVPYFGRVVNFAGDRTYDPWTVTVMNDEDFKVRNALESWSDSINMKQQNIRENINYKSTAQVIQYGKTGNIIRQYTLNGIYPARIEPIRLDWGDVNQFERFNVTFIYDYWQVDGGNSGNAGGL